MTTASFASVTVPCKRAESDCAKEPFGVAKTDNRTATATQPMKRRVDLIIKLLFLDGILVFYSTAGAARIVTNYISLALALGQTIRAEPQSRSDRESAQLDFFKTPNCDASYQSNRTIRKSQF